MKFLFATVVNSVTNEQSLAQYHCHHHAIPLFQFHFFSLESPGDEWKINFFYFIYIYRENNAFVFFILFYTYLIFRSSSFYYLHTSIPLCWAAHLLMFKLPDMKSFCTSTINIALIGRTIWNNKTWTNNTQYNELSY